MQLLCVVISSVLCTSSWAARGRLMHHLFESNPEKTARALHVAHGYNMVHDELIHLRLFRFASTNETNFLNNTNFGDLAWVCEMIWNYLPYGKFLFVWDVKVPKKKVYGEYRMCNKGECLLHSKRRRNETDHMRLGMTLGRWPAIFVNDSGCEVGDPGLEENDARHRWYSLEAPHQHSNPSQDEWLEPHFRGVADAEKLFPFTPLASENRDELFPNTYDRTKGRHPQDTKTPTSLDVMAARLKGEGL